MNQFVEILSLLLSKFGQWINGDFFYRNKLKYVHARDTWIILLLYPLQRQIISEEVVKIDLNDQSVIIQL